MVWMPKDVKTEIADSIPEEVYEKIATEEDCTDPVDLEKWLAEKKHPIVNRVWKEGKPAPLDIPLPNQPWADEAPPEREE